MAKGSRISQQMGWKLLLITQLSHPLCLRQALGGWTAGQGLMDSR